MEKDYCDSSSRRKFIRRSSALISGTLLMQNFMNRTLASSVINAAKDASLKNIGEWLYTTNGLPVYRYNGSLPFYGIDKKGMDAMLPEDPYFILGNYKCTLFAHASGIIQFLTGERAWARINAAEEINYGANTASLSVNDGNSKKSYALIGIGSLGADTAITKKFFGTGFARYEYRLSNQIECTRILSVKPSPVIHSGNPCVVITVLLKNTGTEKITIDYEEKMIMNYLPVNLQRKDIAKRGVKYINSLSQDAKRRVSLCSVSYSPNTFFAEHKKEDSNFYDTHPVSVFMHGGQNVKFGTLTGERNSLCATMSTSVSPGEEKSYTIVIGLTYEKDFDGINKQVNNLFSGANLHNPAEGLFIHQWKKKLPDLSSETNEIFKREMLWNAYTLESMATYSDYFKETYVPQGMLYTYQDGENISNRDHLQAMLPLCFSNPALARSCLLYVMKHSTYTGEIKRGSGGFGYIEPTVYQESDEQLYLFMCIAEYLRITRDFGLLNESINYYPVEYHKTDNVINILKKHFIYLRDVVSTGRNGLVRILNSDWSDSFFHKYSPNIYASTAESILNTTMALAVLPKFVLQLNECTPAKPALFITAIEKYHKELLEAFLADFGNRNFAARCYLNGGKQEKLGMDNVCIEPQGYLLQIPQFSIEKKIRIYNKVKTATLSPEKIGFRTREVPMWSIAGEGEDGGIWFSLEGAVVAGVSTFDKTEAWRLLQKMSFNNYAKQYPDYWVGHWTFPDFVNSSLSAREGLYTYWEPNLKNVFKAFCSHPHSWPLYLYFKLKE